MERAHDPQVPSPGTLFGQPRPPLSASVPEFFRRTVCSKFTAAYCRSVVHNPLVTHFPQSAKTEVYERMKASPLSAGAEAEEEYFGAEELQEMVERSHTAQVPPRRARTLVRH